MNLSVSSRFPLWVGAFALASLVLAPVSELLAEHHMPGRDDPWNNCTFCHGSDLLGDLGRSCMSCHNDFSTPDPPESGHHMPGRDDPVTNCAACHGQDLMGGIGTSCYTCHDALWPDTEQSLSEVSLSEVSLALDGNLPPNVVSGGPYQGTPDVPVQFDASGTNDPDGDILIYLWSFGDKTQPPFPSQNPTISHAYESVGTYAAVLTVTDGVNDPVMVDVNVEISLTANLPPVAVAGGSYSGTAEQSVQFNGSGSSDPDGDALTYSWNFGDGTAPSGPSSIATATHTYASAGSYTAVLTVDDGFNAPVSASTAVEIAAAPTDPPNPPSATGDDWEVILPFVFEELTVSFEEFGSILLVHVTPLGGEPSFGVGMEIDGLIFWMDVTGSLFYGNLDQTDGTGWGMVFGYQGGASSVWFAEKQ